MALSLLLLAVVGICYLLTRYTYRLYFSPLAQFPGPKLAALTFWYEGYYDIVRQGRYTWKIRDLHARYGPIVRINPEELHIQDAGFYDRVYVGATRRTNKWGWSAKMFGTSKAAVGTIDHDLHKLRRSALNPFFAKSAVEGLEPVIWRDVGLLIRRVTEVGGEGDRVVNLSDAFVALSADVIGSYCFGRSYGFLERKDFNPEWRQFMTDLSQGTHLMKQFGWAYQILIAVVPETIIAFLHPLPRELFKLQHGITDRVLACKKELEESESTKPKSHRTVFHDLIQDSHLPLSELATTRLSEEGLTLIGAGTVTTAHTLETITFTLLSSPEFLLRLQTELTSNIATIESSSSRWTALTHLPYLSAIISEGLRLSFGVAHRLPRVSPNQPLQYRDWTIPAGTPVSMTNMFIHLDPDMYPDPQSFRPERWLEPVRSLSSDTSDTSDTVDPSVARKYLVPFSKGTRSCVAMNLAYAELFLTVYALFRPGKAGGLRMETFETTGEGLEIVHDFFSPHAKRGSKGLRVRVHQDD